jgi:hypothetical protein
MTTDVLPQPQAVDAVVWHDIGERVLYVRLPDKASGYDRALWAQGWQQLRRAEEAGWPSNAAPWVYASVPGADRVVHGGAGDAGCLRFHFPPKTPGYSELISKPGVVAIAVLDRGSQRFLSVRFLNRPAPR